MAYQRFFSKFDNAWAVASFSALGSGLAAQSLTREQMPVIAMLAGYAVVPTLLLVRYAVPEIMKESERKPYAFIMSCLALSLVIGDGIGHAQRHHLLPISASQYSL